MIESTHSICLTRYDWYQPFFFYFISHVNSISWLCICYIHASQDADRQEYFFSQFIKTFFLILEVTCIYMYILVNEK